MSKGYCDGWSILELGFCASDEEEDGDVDLLKWHDIAFIVANDPVS